MDDTGYVETSDQEELEIIQGACNVSPATPIHRTCPPMIQSLEVPRKRRKTYHSPAEANGVKDADPSSEASVDMESTTPILSSPGLPTSTAISDDECHDHAEYLAKNEFNPMDKPEDKANHVGRFSEVLDDGVSMDFTYDTYDTGSQDELDVISQSLSQTGIGRTPCISPPTLGSATMRLDRLSNERTSDRSEDTTKREAHNQPHDSHSLFSSWHGDTSSRRNASLNDTTPELTLPPSPRQFRWPTFPSLPPSSPPGTTTFIPSASQGSRSVSPDQVQPQSNGYGHGVGVTQPPDAYRESILQFSDNDDDSAATRRYPLRARQARQLNPYEYDKRLYKQQMRRLPDAIVKIVSPRRHSSGRTHKRHDGNEDDDFIVSEDEDETQGTTRRREKDRASSDALQNSYENQEESITWLPKAFDMSDDELTPLPPDVARKSPIASASEDLGKVHKSRYTRFHKFPLKEARVRRKERTGHVDRDGFEEAHGETHSAITYARRKDSRSAFQDRTVGGNATPLESNPRRPLSLPASQIDKQYAFGPVSLEGGDDELLHDLQREDARSETADVEDSVTDHNVGFDDEDLDGNAHVSSHDDSALQDDKSRLLHSDSESVMDSDEDQREAELSRRDRKRMRHLRRMLPAVMIARLSGQGSASVKRRARSRSKSAVAESDDDDDDESLVPGRSMTRKRSSTPRTAYPIKGDTESSGQEQGPVKNRPKNVVEIESSPDSDNYLASSPSDESDDNRLERSVAAAGYFDHDFTRQPVRRREEPLIDLMLCRTRTKKALSGTKQIRKSGVSGRVGGRSLKGGGIDVNVPQSQSQRRSVHDRLPITKQTRLPFESATSFTNRYPGTDMADLTNVTAPFEGVENHANAIADAEELEPFRKLTKKQRREVAQKGTLHTFAGDGKGIGSGRRRGFMHVQIDMADDSLKQALKPLRPDNPLQILRSIRTAPALKQLPSRRNDNGGDSALKQTSLHDFADHRHVTDDYELTVPIRRPAVPQITPEWHEETRVHTCTLDMNIVAPTPGLAFGASTYLGKQFLTDLLDFVRNGTLLRPTPYAGFGLIDLNAETSVGGFVESLEAACNTLSEWLDEELAEAKDEDNVRRYEHLMHSICHFTAWVYASADAEGRKNVQTVVSSCATRLTEKLVEKAERHSVGLCRLDLRWLAVTWFIVELTTRMLAGALRQGSVLDVDCWRGAVILLVKSLENYGTGKALKPIEAHEMATPSTPLRATELWICLIHLLPEINGLRQDLAGNDGTFWSIILQVVKDNKESSLSNIEFSEQLWKLIFSLCTLSHFSSHGIATADLRLPPCWEIVGLALDTIRLTHDKDKDSYLPRGILKRRDRYVRMVMARCFLLGTKWNWPLADAYVMFKKLVDIFRSRNFANLLGEESEFPAFLRYQNVGFLEGLRASDTAFGIYLKLVTRATEAESNIPRGDMRLKARQAKLLSLAVPLSGVAFSKAHPPTTDELPMLINRFSAIISAILIDGKENANIWNRTNHARRFISFVDADDRSRDICIKAATYMAIAASHLSLDLDEPLIWLGEMCQTLLEEFQSTSATLQLKAADAWKANSGQGLRHRLVLSLHLLLRCVRNIVEKPTMGTEESTPRYPAVGLLSGLWVKRIFSMKELTNMVTTRLQILQLIHAFLQARERVIPPPRRSVPATTSEETSESQDLFIEFGLDDDLLALLSVDGGIDEKQKKDREVAEIMNTDVVPHIFRLLLQCFNDPISCSSDESKLEDFWDNADDWIDCWVGCAAIVVRNEIRSWDHYLNVGPQSWSGISNSFFRRRVAVRFMYRLLKCDPNAYNKDHERHFLGVCLQSLVAHKITMENEYLSALFSIDGLRHTMLRDVLVIRAPRRDGFQLTRAGFLHVREDIITGIFSNLNACLNSSSSEYNKNVFVECVVDMLSAMQDIWKNLASIEDRVKYGELCRHVFSNIRKHPRIQSLQRLATYVTWGSSFDGPVV